MNVLDNYTRRETKLIEGLSLNEHDQLVPILASNTLTQGTPINLYNIRKLDASPDYSINLTWNKYPIDLHTVLDGDGTYIILIKYGNALYSGIFSYLEDLTESGLTNPNSEEIVLHMSGTFTRSDLTDDSIEGRIYTKLVYNIYTGSTYSANKYHYPDLYLSCSEREDNVNANITIKFRKLL